jgi:hypothetical protein
MTDDKRLVWILASVFAVGLIMGCSNSTDQHPSSQQPIASKIRPGGIFEHCLPLIPDEALSYSFQASHALAFNIHYHVHDTVYYPIEEHVVQAETRSFKPSIAQRYCLIWQNPGPEAARLSLTFATKE